MRSRIEWDVVHRGWAIYCALCGEYIETLSEKPDHHTLVCGVIECDEDEEEDTWANDLDEGYVEEW